jgi:hypothetical protein
MTTPRVKHGSGVGLRLRNKDLKVQHSLNLPRPCLTGAELLAEQFRGAATVARAILDRSDLVDVKAQYKLSRDALEQHILACDICRSGDPF